MKQSVFLKLRPFLVTAVLAAAWLAHAQSNAPTNGAVILEALVKEALEKNPELAFYQAEIAAAKGARKTAGVLANPELSAGVGRKSVRGPGASGDGVAWSVSLMQPFEWPGRLGLRKAIANRDLELANLGLERFRTALAGRVRTLAYGLFAAQEKAQAAREVAERFRELREVLVQRDPAGLTPLLETRVIEATELNAQRKASEAVLAQQSALLELNQLRGAAPETALIVGPPQLTFPEPPGKAVLVAMARTNNFDVRLRTLELEQQGFRVNLARNERRPAISVGPFVSHESAGGDRELQVGIGLSMPLPLWNRNQGNVASAEARRVQAETSLLLAVREVERKVLEGVLTYETKVREMARWRPDSVAHFRDAAEVADRHYRLGAVPISTYVELQKQYLEAMEALLETKHEALEAALQLELLTGSGFQSVAGESRGAAR
jgi:cobalt-zinc-cadmium efflux system outer membrane protein